MEEPVQKSLERYDVLDRIAVGGMAEVFLAKAYGAHGFEKTLAIKRILPELASDPEFAQRFIAEAKVAVRLSHANVVQVFDFGRIGESLFIAMEFVDGLDLAQLNRKFKDEGRLVPLPAAFHIAIEIMRALDFAHSHNVVHRDVSPSNILISRAGEVKIGDFGIAVAAQPHKAGGAGVRKVMGKWRYMSPEQTRGDVLDTRSDLFSAASVMFELFTGQKLFPGDEAEEIIKNIADMPIPKASALRPGLPSRLDDILGQALARKPIDRPNRPAQLLRSLIELSYESSIMATALDVAECVASVLPVRKIPGAGTQLDDVIRKQLGQAEKSVARQTAVTSNKPPSTETNDVSTGMFRKIDIDGVSRLEEVDPVDPTAIAAPRARRASEGGASLAASSPDSGLHKLLGGGKKDIDRHTEVGGPPTGAVPKTAPEDVAEERSESKSVTQSVGGGRRGLVAVVALVVVGGGAFAVWRLTGKSAPAVVVATADAATPVVVSTTSFDIDSIPSGAAIFVDGKPIGKGPIRGFAVAPNSKVKIRFELAGYEPFEREYATEANRTKDISPSLARAASKLHVETIPPGAQVSLAGRPLGDTPLDVENLGEQKGAELVITKAGFDPDKLKIDLVAGEMKSVKRELKQRYGEVQITCACWANVYFKNALVGKAPGDQIKLPVGRQRLRLDNPDAHKSWNLDVDVPDGRLAKVKTTLGGQ
jgi:serine/threonine protein kinase